MQRVELEDSPASYKSVVWENFGFPVQYSNDGNRVVDRTKTVCRPCSAEVGYVGGMDVLIETGYSVCRGAPFIPMETAQQRQEAKNGLHPGTLITHKSP